MTPIYWKTWVFALRINFSGILSVCNLVCGCTVANTSKWMINLPSVLWCSWLGGRKGIRPVKKLESWGTGIIICVYRGANDLHVIQLMDCHPIISVSTKILTGLRFWCRLTQVVVEKRSLNGCSGSSRVISYPKLNIVRSMRCCWYGCVMLCPH